MFKKNCNLRVAPGYQALVAQPAHYVIDFESAFCRLYRAAGSLFNIVAFCVSAILKTLSLTNHPG